MPPTLLVVGMQRDKISAMSRGGEGALISSCTMRHDARCATICSEVNRCIDYAMKNGWGVTFAMDMHHPNHPSFDVNGGTLRPHCVLRTMGFEPPTGLRFGDKGMDMIFRGIELDGDSADAFWVTEKMCSSRLQLSEEGVVLCGTSPDGCIENTMATAIQKGIPTYIAAEGVWLLGELPEGVRILNLSLTDSC
jgi:nicotinamidase-related amidase